MKKFFTVLLTLAMVFSFASVAFAADYNWGKEPVPCEEYTIDITKYEMVVENGKSKLIESANVAAKKGDTVYFSVNVYNKEYKNEELILVFNGQDFHITNLEDVVVTISGIKDLDIYSESKGIFKGVVYADVPCLTISIQSTSTIQELIDNGVVTPYGSFIKIGNVVFERDANYCVIGAYQYDKSLDNYLAVGDFTPVRRIKATDAQLAAFGMSAALVTEGVYLVDADTIVKNLGTSCLAEKTVCWGTPVVPGTNGTLGLPQTGDAPNIVGFAMLGAAVVACAIIVIRKKIYN